MSCAGHRVGGPSYRFWCGNKVDEAARPGALHQEGMGMSEARRVLQQERVA